MDVVAQIPSMSIARILVKLMENSAGLPPGISPEIPQGIFENLSNKNLKCQQEEDSHMISQNDFSKNLSKRFLLVSFRNAFLSMNFFENVYL